MHGIKFLYDLSSYPSSSVTKGRALGVEGPNKSGYYSMESAPTLHSNSTSN